MGMRTSGFDVDGFGGHGNRTPGQPGFLSWLNSFFCCVVFGM